MFKAFLTLDFDNDSNIDCKDVPFMGETEEELRTSIRKFIDGKIALIFVDTALLLNGRISAIEGVLKKMWLATFESGGYWYSYGNWEVSYKIWNDSEVFNIDNLGMVCDELF